MKFRRTYGSDDREYSLKEVLADSVHPDPYIDGEIERLREHVSNLTELVVTMAVALEKAGTIQMDDLPYNYAFSEIEEA